MTPIQLLWLGAGLFWALAELSIVLASRKRALANDQRSLYKEHWIWIVVCLSLLAGLVIKERHLWPLPLPADIRQLVAMAVFLAGLALRLYAVFSLGRLFSSRVSIQPAHVLVTTGPYRYIRHPSYSGLIGGFTGAGIAMGDVLAMSVLLLPLFYVLCKRIEVEERCLHKHFGQDYLDYCRVTKKMFPLIY
ncbi:isoprenylcysteine carboxylmethyltransferase family protein [Methylomarinum sp. Ch1-1]|uniref:Isoprenylcysteine carboxylmethyltransferase family protein n=1 Tax=Methylomarinum roseum TaxID=3067653 RepID=A0AAU7NUP7_9GAMM|nr:isoprenylcysteine carboxylmethyltransferase family protein [Methylomarinum sp. Ch1-1]MDP4519596.1 isoprenylcysteine carboxylmethyltransferase family protein [Methylomarinum sp. Ch1-1]